MPHRLHRFCRNCAATLFAWLVRSWREAPPMPRATAAGLDIPLVPSPLVRRARWCFLGLQVLYACELLLLGHLLVGPVVLALAWLLLPGPGGRRRAQPLAPRRLLLAADGRLHLLTAGGRVEPVRLHASSLRLGPWLLLRLVTPGGPCRLLLGPDNLAPPALAALRRRMVLVDQAAEAVAPGHGWLVAGGSSTVRPMPDAEASAADDAARHQRREPGDRVR